MGGKIRDLTPSQCAPIDLVLSPAGGGVLPDKRDGGAHRKIRIKPLKDTNVGVAQA